MGFVFERKCKNRDVVDDEGVVGGSYSDVVGGFKGFDEFFKILINVILVRMRSMYFVFINYEIVRLLWDRILVCL